jgi:hypothetical protein
LLCEFGPWRLWNLWIFFHNRKRNQVSSSVRQFCKLVVIFQWMALESGIKRKNVFTRTRSTLWHSKGGDDFLRWDLKWWSITLLQHIIISFCSQYGPLLICPEESVQQFLEPLLHPSIQECVFINFPDFNSSNNVNSFACPHSAPWFYYTYEHHKHNNINIVAVLVNCQHCTVIP